MLIIQVGKLCINIPETKVRFGIRRTSLMAWCLDFGVGSAAWWPRGFDRNFCIKFRS